MKTTWRSIIDSRWIYVLLLLPLLALRLPHLAGPIDDPHSWRQSDTAYYALDFYRSGIDLLRPKVCWSGNFGVLALEFPLPEALTALLYHLFGFDHLWARLVTLAFFCGSQIYLFKIVAQVATRRLAALTAIVYALLPLSLFYSRAIHVDFCAVFFAHAMLYHFLHGFERGRRRDILLGAVFGGLGFAVKAPYLFYLYLPLAVTLIRRRVWAGSRRGWLLALLLPPLAFLLWRSNVGHVNADKPLLDIYPKFVERLDWYFGSLGQRLDIETWLVLLQRLIFDVANPVGLLLLAWGLWGWLRGPRRAWRGFFESWLLGAAAYVLLFYNLNWAHNYYQIPLLAIVSVFIAGCLDRFADLRSPYGLLLSTGLFILLGGVSLWYAGRAYYHVDWRAVQAGQIIRENTSADDLVVVYLYDDNFEYSDPRLLYRARRRGWSIRPSDITAERLAVYAGEGAHLLAIVESEPDERIAPSWLHALEGQSISLRHQGQDLGTLHLYDLGSLAAATHE
jgi:4-amino-4-deoxy-L-arabinose transferase-like glycosyltransferase